MAGKVGYGMGNKFMTPRVFVFQCSTTTYLECIEKGLFGSNRSWPMQVAKGDYCLLWHYEVGTVLALWRAEADGGHKVVPAAWGGRFPFQVLVTRISPRIVEVPGKAISKYLADPATGRLGNQVEGDDAEALLKELSGVPQ